MRRSRRGRRTSFLDRRTISGVRCCFCALVGCLCYISSRPTVLLGFQNKCSATSFLQTSRRLLNGKIRQSPIRYQAKKKANGRDAGRTSTTCTVATSSGGKFFTELQQCVTPSQLLDRVGRHVSAKNDRDGSLASLVLVRLSKQLVSMDNNSWCSRNLRSQEEQDGTTDRAVVDTQILDALTNHLASRKIDGNDSRLDSLVEGTKACAILARILHKDDSSLGSWCDPMIQAWWRDDLVEDCVEHLQEYHLSGLHWAFDCFRVVNSAAANVDETLHSTGGIVLPGYLQSAYEDLNLPFRIYPGLLKEDLPQVSRFVEEVDFRMDEIRTTASQRVVKERRQTAWEGDENVTSFSYSGKSMPRSDWSPTVRKLRDRLQATTGDYYDGCLLNLYPDGQSGMRYHIDPDQGTVWDYDTAVVSVGSTRRFAFRKISNNTHVHGTGVKPQQPHNFVVMHGDVTHMFGDCQCCFQHAVKNADDKREASQRVSLVFKRSWNLGEQQDR